MLKITKKILTTFLSILFVITLVLACNKNTNNTITSTNKMPNDKNIVVLFTNDVHCGVNDNIGYAGLSYYKNKIDQNENYVALVDAGDFSQGAPIGTASKGKYIIDIMEKIGYDFAVPGDHEFDYGMQTFLTNCIELQNVIFCCNFVDVRTNSPVLNPYKIMTFGNKKVAFVGCTTPESFTKSTPKYFEDDNGDYIYSFFEDATGDALYNCVQKACDDAKNEGADYVVLVGHLGMNGTTDRWKSSEVVKHTNNIDFVIDGHSHEIYNEQVANKDGKIINICQTGTKLNDFGKLTITKDGEFIPEIITIDQVSSAKDERGQYIPDRDPEITGFIDEIESKFSQYLKEVVYHDNTVELMINDPSTGVRIVRSQETNLGDLVADAFKTVLGADIGFTNGGGIRGELHVGDITFNDCLTVMPFNNMATMIVCSGQVIKDALEFGTSKLPEENGGFIHVSGLTYEINTKIPTSVVLDEKEKFVKVDGEYRVSNIKVNGIDLDLNKKYTLASHDYMLINGGDGFTMFKGTEVKKSRVLPDVDVFVDYLKAEGTSKYSNPYGEGRIIIN